MDASVEYRKELRERLMGQDTPLTEPLYEEDPGLKRTIQEEDKKPFDYWNGKALGGRPLAEDSPFRYSWGRHGGKDGNVELFENPDKPQVFKSERQPPARKNPVLNSEIQPKKRIITEKANPNFEKIPTADKAIGSSSGKVLSGKHKVI